MNISFDDLENPDDFIARPAKELVAVDHSATVLPPGTFWENCSKCRGSGIYYGRSSRGSKCFPCKGAGGFARKTTAEQRAKAKVSREAAKVRNADAAWDAFVVASPEVAAWISSRKATFNFAANMDQAVRKYGSLTEGQLSAIARCQVADKAFAERKAREAEERAQVVANAPVLDIAKIEQTIQTALGNRIKRPILRLADFKFSPAPSTGKNAGAIYVKATSGDYLGKVQGGKFVRSYTCDAVTEAEIVKVASDPAAAAVAYGKKYGQCSCCGKELSDPISVERGIGPVCATKFGW